MPTACLRIQHYVELETRELNAIEAGLHAFLRVNPIELSVVIAASPESLYDEGWFLSQTPSTDGRGAFQDPTHVSMWNSNSCSAAMVEPGKYDTQPRANKPTTRIGLLLVDVAAAELVIL